MSQYVSFYAILMPYITIFVLAAYHRKKGEHTHQITTEHTHTHTSDN